MNRLTSHHVKRLAFESGFDLCGVTSPEIIPESRERFQDWIAKEYHGEMAYMAKDTDRRTDPSLVMPDVQSIIMLGMNYYQPNSPTIPADSGHVSRYARGRDYHKVIEDSIKRLIGKFGDEGGLDEDAKFKWYVDYGPLTERPYAEKAGLGFIGKNGMLINSKFGSWIFLSAILTNISLEFDERNPISHGSCGDCRLCIEACPTGAIISPRTIDSRRCVSYLTVERPTEIPESLSKHMKDLIFGCDICQEVCPYNKKPINSSNSQLQSESGVGEYLNLTALLNLQSRDDFLNLVAGTPLTRPRMEGLQRSALIVRKNNSEKRKFVDK